jgi:flagellar assembly protein FliH
MMSSFRPGRVPLGVVIAAPSWPALEPITLIKDYPPATTPLEAPSGTEREAPHERADEILEQANLQAAQLLQMAASEAESALSEARQQGFAAGKEEGLQAVQTELQQVHNEAKEAVEQARTQAALIRQTAEAEAKAARAEAELQVQAVLRQAREEAAAIAAQARQEQRRLLDDAQTALVDLAVTAAVRLVQGHLALKPAAIVAMVAAGLRRLKDTECTVRVGPGDLPLLEAQRATLERELGAGLLQIQPDPGMQRGSYIAISPYGQIDAQIEQQATHLRSALGAALGGEGQ